MTSSKELSLMLSPDGIEMWFDADMLTGSSSLCSSSLLPAGRLAELKEFSPSIDMYVDGNELVLKADLPGVRKEDIGIDITGTMLTISGERKREETIKDNCCYYRFERSEGVFSRRFELPEEIDTDKVKTHFENGVLELRIPKTEEAASKTRKIPVN